MRSCHPPCYAALDLLKFSYPVADEIRGADVDERTDATLQERADVVLRGEPEVVKVRPEGLFDVGRVPAEVAAHHGRVDPKQLLRALAVEEVADVSAGTDGSQGVGSLMWRRCRTP